MKYSQNKLTWWESNKNLSLHRRLNKNVFIANINNSATEQENSCQAQKIIGETDDNQQ